MRLNLLWKFLNKTPPSPYNSTILKSSFLPLPLKVIFPCLTWSGIGKLYKLVIMHAYSIKTFIISDITIIHDILYNINNSIIGSIISIGIILVVNVLFKHKNEINNKLYKKSDVLNLKTEWLRRIVYLMFISFFCLSMDIIVVIKMFDCFFYCVYLSILLESPITLMRILVFIFLKIKIFFTLNRKDLAKLFLINFSIFLLLRNILVFSFTLFSFYVPLFFIGLDILNSTLIKLMLPLLSDVLIYFENLGQGWLYIYNNFIRVCIIPTKFQFMEHAGMDPFEVRKPLVEHLKDDPDGNKHLIKYLGEAKDIVVSKLIATQISFLLGSGPSRLSLCALIREPEPGWRLREVSFRNVRFISPDVMASDISNEVTYLRHPRGLSLSRRTEDFLAIRRRHTTPAGLDRTMAFIKTSNSVLEAISINSIPNSQDFIDKDLVYITDRETLWKRYFPHVANHAGYFGLRLNGNIYSTNIESPDYRIFLEDNPNINIMEFFSDID